MHAAHLDERAVRVRDRRAVHGVVVHQPERHRADGAVRRGRRDAPHQLAARVRRRHRLRAAKLAKEAAPVRQRDASAPHLDERAARERAGARVHAVRRTHLVLEARAAARVLLLVERERDHRDARRVRRRDAVHLGRARPRRGDRARVEAAPHVAELRRARREAAASHVHKGAAAHRPAHRLERAQRHRPQILKVHARRTEVAPVGAHLERHVPRRRGARRGALELPS